MGKRRHQIWDDEYRIRMSETIQPKSVAQMAVSDDQTDNFVSESCVRAIDLGHLRQKLASQLGGSPVAWSRSS